MGQPPLFSLAETPVDITVTGTVSDLAIAQVNGGMLTVDLGKVRAGDEATGFIPIANVASVGAQTLDAEIAATTDDIDDNKRPAWSISWRRAPPTTPASLTSLDTTDAGSKDGSVVFDFQSDLNHTLTALPSQTFEASVDVSSRRGRSDGAG